MVSATARQGNAVLTDLILPSRSLAYTKLMRGERNSKAGKHAFTGLDIAEPKLSLFKADANERQKSLLLVARVQLSLFKADANERKESLLSISRVQLGLYKGKNNI